jgi:hypothetical protein
MTKHAIICGSLVLSAIVVITAVVVWWLHRKYALAAPAGSGGLMWIEGCDYCSSGVQSLACRDGRTRPTWGPIPRGDRIMVNRDDDYRGTPLVNKRTCPECQGRAGHLVPRDRKPL